MRLSLCSCLPTMYSINNLSFRPVSTQSPRRVFNIDNKQNGSGRLGGLKLTLRRRQICKKCTSQKIENEKLLHEIHWLKTGVQNMLRDKEIEVCERVSMTMEDLCNENQRLKEKLFIEERIRVWGTSHTPFDKVDCIRKSYHRSLDEITDLERKISEMENEAWNLKSIIHKKNLELYWFAQDMEKKENDAFKMKQRLLEVEFDNCGYRIALHNMTEDCNVVNARFQELDAENNQLKKALEVRGKSLFSFLDGRNSNAADEMKISQTAVEEKQAEILRWRDNCTLNEEEITDLKKKYSNVSEERDNLFQRNQLLQGKSNELHAKIRYLEENRRNTTDEWKDLEKVRNSVVQLGDDNDRLKKDIDTLSKEKDNALSRSFIAEKEVRQLKLDIKSKIEEIQRLQKHTTQKEGDNEKLQERLSNTSKEKEQLWESNKRLEKVNGQILLATDESKCWQEKIKELQNENRHLRHDIDDLSKQKKDAIKRIRDLESVNANYNDQLLLATDESKRLQGRIKDLQGEKSRLRRDIDDLSKQKEDALTRLSKVAGAKLTHGNAAITDLSDTDRPTKLAEKFSELYDNAWTDAFEELDNTFHNEEKTIKVLLQIFQEAYTFCVETENNYETRIELAVFTLASKTGSHQIQNTNVEIQKVLADLRISLSTACCSVIEEMVLSKLPSILKSVDVAACPLTKLFACQCASLSWKMRIRDPPLFVRFEFRCGSTFNADVLKRYTKTGGYLDFLVWPTLYLHEKGPVLAKGVAQPKIAP